METTIISRNEKKNLWFVNGVAVTDFETYYDEFPYLFSHVNLSRVALGNRWATDAEIDALHKAGFLRSQAIDHSHFATLATA